MAAFALFIVCLVQAASFSARSQFFDPVLFAQNGNGELPEPVQSSLDEPHMTGSYNDAIESPDTQSRIHAPVSNAASMAKEDSTTFNRDIKRRPGLVLERWDGLDGYDIKNLVQSSRFPTLPNYLGYTDAYTEPPDWGDSYGSRIRGYFVPPLTGDYIFQLASDAQGQLYISTDENPKRKVMIAEVSMDHTTEPHEYNKYREQTSQAVYLDKGKYYYTEVLHKDQFLADHVNVKVKMPDGKEYDPIPKQFLWTLPPPKKKPPAPDPLMLVKVAAKAGAHAGATLGQKEAAEKGALAGANAGEKAGMKAGAAAGAIAARKAATRIAIKTIQEALRNITLNRHVFNIYTGNSSMATATSTSNAAGNATAGASGTAGGGATAGGNGTAGGGVTGTPNVLKPKVFVTNKQKGGGQTPAKEYKPVYETKKGENAQNLAKKYVNRNGAATKVVVGAMYIIHSLNIPATQEFKKNLCWRSTYGNMVLGRRCQVWIARKGFVVRGDGQQTVSWESACLPGYYIVQKNYHYTLAKIGSTKKFYIDSTFTAFRTLKFPEAFMFSLLRKGWFVCESRETSFHVTDLVARYNEPTIAWLQRCSFVIRPIEGRESATMNCFEVLKVFQSTTAVPITNATVAMTTPTTPAPEKPAIAKVEYMVCLRIEFINDAGLPFRLLSNLKPQGYYVYGKVFELKYVLPKATDTAPEGTATQGTVDNVDVVKEAFEKKTNIGRDARVHGNDRTIRSVTHSSHRHKPAGMKIYSSNADKRHKERTKDVSRKSNVPQRTSSDGPVGKVLGQIGHSTYTAQEEMHEQKPSRKTNVEQVLKAIAQPTSTTSQKKVVTETFPQPRDMIGSTMTKIIFSAIDPSNVYNLLLNGRKAVSVVIAERCIFAVQVVVHVTKNPKTTTAPPTTPTTPKPTTPAPPPPLPLAPEPPPPLPPPPPPIQTTRPTVPTTPTTQASTTRPTPPPPTSALPPPIPATQVPPPPLPPLPPPPPPVQTTTAPTLPPAIIIIPAGCMPTHEGTSNGACCFFPFTYKGVEQNRCIRADRNFRWCATTKNYDNDKEWGFCPHCNVAHGGTAGGDCCHFPFIYKSKVYQKCIRDSNGKPWCATTYNFDLDQKWGYCGGPTHAIKTPLPPPPPPPTEIPPAQETFESSPPCPSPCSVICLPNCPASCCSGHHKSAVLTPQRNIGDIGTCSIMCKRSCEEGCPEQCCQNGCPVECLSSCKPHCPPRCCFTVLIPIADNQSVKEKCPAVCKETCKPECPLSCCLKDARGCPAICVEDCKPGCPPECCFAVLKPIQENREHSQSCPKICFTSCKPSCPVHCCSEHSNACPQECSTDNCKPSCPSECCLTVLTPLKENKSHQEECPAVCSESCKPDCPIKCCSNALSSCPQSCSGDHCGAECPTQCCLLADNGQHSSTASCPSACSPSGCNPDCPARCCITVLQPLNEKHNTTAECPSECSETCKPECPVKCCTGECPAGCLPSNCKPDCPSKCCLTILEPLQEGPNATAYCPSDCFESCKPNCPMKCCPATAIKCPVGCSEHSCEPECPSKCCMKVLPPTTLGQNTANSLCPVYCLTSCKPDCPIKCCTKLSSSCPADCSPQNCKSSCPSICCITIRGSAKEEQQNAFECPVKCLTSCEPECPVRCCSGSQTLDLGVSKTCPSWCSVSSCKPDCPARCCTTEPLSACPATCSPDSCRPECPLICCSVCPPNCSAQSCGNFCPPKCCTSQLSKDRQKECQESCPKVCGPGCPVQCCSDLNICPANCTGSACKPGCITIEDSVTVSLGNDKLCPEACLTKCLPSCPSTCCIKNSPPVVCPKSCETTCTPDCPVMCCKNSSPATECPTICASKCISKCPEKCCKQPEPQPALLSTTPTPPPPPKPHQQQQQPTCSTSCLTLCTPDCPKKCCSKPTKVGSAPTPSQCPSSCLLACQPSCPMECCLAAFTSKPVEVKPTSLQQECPPGCPKNCEPSCPVRCCSMVISYDKKNVIHAKKQNIPNRHRKHHRP
ncbi:uncharacterized protein LOC5503106 isoform X2 [Nematostella vectensis]|uniref:uncharacterized protein LOC5503106 isoform X2 n=1 Tax=Nematostella vectensis TaxID=45351 RepID=UPI00207762F5|nr:uncharacterized protein LOC5503106 isoform X2 [Nematostella vectensis]